MKLKNMIRLLETLALVVLCLVLAFFALAVYTVARADSEIILRTWGDPTKTGRQLSLTLQVLPDGSGGITFMGMAVDGTSPITKIEYQTGPGTFLGSGTVINSCLMANLPPDSNGCNVLWTWDKMIAGNNDFAMVATNAAAQRFFVVGKISRPTKQITNFLLCGTQVCTDGTGSRLTAN